ncbi:hypothetical protein ACFPRL_14805 [Pseudoclavibacter helvolus]
MTRSSPTSSRGWMRASRCPCSSAVPRRWHRSGRADTCPRPPGIRSP